MEAFTILIAEDDTHLVRLWQTVFKDAGYNVVAAYDGQEAIDWLQANPLPDVVIVDYNMPQANGVAVLQALAELEGSADVKTVMITANHVVQTDEVEALIDMFLQKPVGFQDMRTLVDRLTQRN